MSQSKPLSYPSSRCVLQHIHEITRFHIAICCPTLCTIHATTPLRIKYLKLTDSGFHLNNCIHFFHIKTRRNQSYVCYSIRVAGMVYNVCDFPVGVRLEHVIKKHIEGFLLRNYPLVVNHLEFDKIDRIERLPGASKFIVKQLQIPSEALETVLPFLDRSSFPLKKLSIKVTGPNDPIFESEICRASECLNIESSLQEDWLQRVIGLPHKTVQMTADAPCAQTLGLLAQNWMENSRAVGTKFSFAAIGNLRETENISSQITQLTGINAVKIYTSKCLHSRFPMRDRKDLHIHSYRSTEYEEKMISDNPHAFPVGVSRERIIVKSEEFSRWKQGIPKEQLGNFYHRDFVLVMEVRAAGAARV